MRVPALSALLCLPAMAQQATDAVAPEAPSGVAAKQAVTARARWSWPPTPTPPRPASRCCAPAAAPPTRWSPCRPCSASSSRNPRASAAAPSSSGTMPRPASVTTFDAPRDRAGRGDARPLPRPRRQAARLLRRRGRRPLGRRAGVPRLLETVHGRFGKRPWASLFAAGHRAGRQRALPSRRASARSIADDTGRLDGQPATRAYFFDADGDAARRRRRRCAIRTTPRRCATLATGGADAFYDGPLADRIVAAVRDHATNPGLLSTQDMAAYRSRSGPPSARPIAATRSAAWVRPPPARSPSARSSACSSRSTSRRSGPTIRRAGA